MNTVLHIATITGMLLYFFVFFVFMRKKALSLKYSLLWLFAGLIMLIIAIFPDIMTFVTKLIGIQTVSNTVFSLVLFFLIIITITITSIVSKQSEKIKRLIQTTALLEKRIRELEDK